MFLLVLFVLLTVAAVVVGYLIFVRGIATKADITPNRPTPGASASSVAGREDVLASRTAIEAPPVAIIARADVR